MPVQKSFNSGVLSRQVWGRSDLVKFGSGARTMRNIICLSHGPATRRSGTEFIYGAEDNAVKGLLYGFEFSPDQAYMIEFCDLKVRFFRNGQIILDGGSPYELVSPYSESDLPDLDFAPIGDVIYISHPDYNTRALTRFDDNSWTIAEVAHDGGPYLAENTTDTTLAPSVPGTGVAWDIRGASYSGISLYVEPIIPFGTGVEFSADGSKAFICTSSTNIVAEYSLPTPGSLWGAVFVDFFSVAAQQQNLQDISFSADGTTMYTCGRQPQAFHQFTLATAWKINTASYASKTFSYASEQADGFGLSISVDGAKIYVCGISPSAAFEYDLGVAGDVSSSVYNSVSFSLTGEGDFPFSMRFKSDGTRLYVGFADLSPAEVYQYDMSPWDLNTAVSLSSGVILTASAPDEISGLALNSSGTKMYALGASGGTSDYVFEYNISSGGGGSGTTITAFSVEGINGGAGFISTDIGRLVAIDQSGVLGVGRIISIISTLVVEVTVLSPFDSIQTSTVWFLGAWSETTGFPEAIAIDNERMWHGRTNTELLGVWGSRLGVYLDHAVSDPIDDESSLSLILSSRKATAIQWLNSGNKFAIGTTGAEHWLSSGTGAGAITPTSKQANTGSSNGVSSVTPIMVGSNLVYIQRHGKVVRELVYSYDKDNFGGQELQLLAEHLTRNNSIVDMAYQRTPYKIVWCVRDDGALLGLTYYPEHEVFGWHIHDIGGAGIVESIDVIAGGEEDELWMIVRRVRGGSTVRNIERFHETFKSDIDTTDAFFVDSGITVDNRQDITSLTHANPGVFNKVAHGYSNGDPITIRSVDEDISGEEDLLSLNNETFTVWAKTADTFQAKDVDGNIVNLLEYKQVVSSTSGLNVTAISGLDHLEGETVQALTDGYYQDDYLVSGGAITLDNAASVVHVGFQFISDLEPVPPQFDQLEDSGANIDKKISNINLELYKTLGFKYGKDADHLTEYQFSDRDDYHGQPSPLYDGYLPDGALEIGGDYELDPTVLIRQDEPLPLTVLSLITDVDLNTEE